MVEDFLKILCEDENFKNKIESIKKLESHEAVYSQIDNLPPQLSHYLNNNNIIPYKHQNQVLEHARSGKNIIITTPTASGKSLAFNLPVLEKLALDKDARALYIYPTKALSHDQLTNFNDLENGTNISINPQSYDGDTKKENKDFIRKKSRIVLTNMYKLHPVLFWHFQWCKFYSNLKYVVIDEAHKYRGVFGSNVAMLIRRLRRIAEYYGSDPQFILSSATLDNAEEFGEKLVGKKFHLVADDGSGTGEKHFVFFNPQNDKDPSKKRDVRGLFSAMVSNDLQTLCFTRTKNETEQIIGSVRKYFEANNKPLSKRIASYRGGYEKKSRRLIEAGLKNRDLIGVVSTNALEIGMDIGGLDAVLISSYPGTLTSTWQMAGRAGRGYDPSLVIIVASKNPLDQFIIKNPDFLLTESNENAIIDLENQLINSNHLLCAAAEIPLQDADIEKFFPLSHRDFNRLKHDKKLIERFNGWEYFNIRQKNAAVELGLQRMDEEFIVYFDGTPKWTENIGVEEAYSKSYFGAIHHYKGSEFVVTDFNFDKHRIQVERKDVDSKSNISKKISLKILQKKMGEKIENFDFSYGSVQIKEKFYKYQTIEGRRVYSKLNVPPYIYESKGMWFEIPSSSINHLEKKINDDEITYQSINGVLRSLLALFHFYVMCDPCDIRGYCDVNNHKIFIYDSHPGGIGLSKKGIDVFLDLVKATCKMVETCPCDEGCAACIYSTHCGINTQKLSKNGTIFLLKEILKEINSQETVKDIDSSKEQKVNIKNY
ncbi:MAG: DEAD/DEAH box helicase [Methanobacterium sp.]|mgnify:FL=1|jgi:DEAD/DEAH box helicase domain-containing protein